MSPSRPNFLLLSLLTFLLVAGSFAAGYLIMTLPGQPPPPLAAATIAPASAPQARFVIKSAIYGDLPDGLATDVTAKVAAAASRGSLTIAASNDNFGDPAEGIVKQLRVVYLIDGVAHTRTVQENETLTIKSVAARLIIKKARYGDLPDGAATDVTEKVSQAAEPDTLTIAASNDNFGDPAEGIVKKLQVDYTLDGKALSKTVGENETLILP